MKPLTTDEFGAGERTLILEDQAVLSIATVLSGQKQSRLQMVVAGHDLDDDVGFPGPGQGFSPN